MWQISASCYVRHALSQAWGGRTATQKVGGRKAAGQHVSRSNISIKAFHQDLDFHLPSIRAIKGNETKFKENGSQPHNLTFSEQHNIIGRRGFQAVEQNNPVLNS